MAVLLRIAVTFLIYRHKEVKQEYAASFTALKTRVFNPILRLQVLEPVVTFTARSIQQVNVEDTSNEISSPQFFLSETELEKQK